MPFNDPSARVPALNWPLISGSMKPSMASTRTSNEKMPLDFVLLFVIKTDEGGGQGRRGRRGEERLGEGLERERERLRRRRERRGRWRGEGDRGEEEKADQGDEE